MKNAFRIAVCAVLVLLFSSYSAQASISTPATDNSDYILVPENFSISSSPKIEIHYHWLTSFDAAKPTFIFLNGGPGASSHYYLLFQDFWMSTELRRRFNILFFDPRGVGQSSSINANNIATKDMKSYTFESMVEDIESLRTQLSLGQKIGLIGHSTGGHLVFSYALKYPKNVLKIISLHGAISEIGFLTQYDDRISEWMKASAGLDQGKLTLLGQKIQSGQACLEDGRTLPQQAWSQIVNYALYGTYSKRLSLPSLLKSLVTGNIDGDSYCKRSQVIYTLSDLIDGPNSLDPLSAMPNLNLIVNANVVCSNLLTFNEVESLSAPYLTGARALWQRDCSPLRASGKIKENPFDVRGDISKVQVPILLVGADHDQWIAPRAQLEAWNALSNEQKKTSKIVILNNCSHFSFYECPADLTKALDEFVQ